MAPRGGPRKRPTGREAIAIDHMRLLGFKDGDICRELKALLKNYGDEGWMFIEMDAYKVLIDALLDVQERGAQSENGDENGNLLEEAPKGENAIVAVSVAADSGPSSVHLLPSSSSIQEAVAQPSDADSVVEDTQPEEGEIGGFVMHDNHPLPPSPPAVNNYVAPHPIAPPHKSRKPCYGWICDDEDDSEDEIIVLPPAPSKFSMRNPDHGNGEIENERKRKSKWDLAPYDL